VHDLKQQDGLDIVVTSSITLTHALIEAGLVAEYRLFVYSDDQRTHKPCRPSARSRDG